MSYPNIKTELPLTEAAINRLVSTEQEISHDVLQKLAAHIKKNFRVPDKTNSKCIEMIKAGLTVARPIEWRNGAIKKTLVIDKFRNTLPALLAESAADPDREDEPCEKCKSGTGEFKHCTTVKGKNGEPLFDGACTNCFGFSRSHKCSLSPKMSNAKPAGDAAAEEEAIVESNRYLRIPLRDSANYSTVKGLWKLLEDINTFTTKFVHAASGAGKVTLQTLSEDEMFKIHADDRLNELDEEVQDFKKWKAFSEMMAQANGGNVEAGKKRKRD